MLHLSLGCMQTLCRSDCNHIRTRPEYAQSAKAKTKIVSELLRIRTLSSFVASGMNTLVERTANLNLCLRLRFGEIYYNGLV
jgi:hypothetical protein